MKKSMDCRSVARQRRCRWRFQTILIQSIFFFATASPRRQSTKQQLIQLDLFCILQASFDSFRLLLKRAGLQNQVFIPATCILENAAKCVKKAATAALLEGQSC